MKIPREDELTDINFKERFTALGAELSVISYQNAFEYRINKDGRLISKVRTDRNQDRLFYKPNKDIPFFINYNLQDLQNQIDTNSRFIPKTIRSKLYVKLFECENFPEHLNPLTSPERKDQLLKERVATHKRDTYKELEEMANSGRLIEYVNQMNFAGKVYTRGEFNKEYGTKFKNGKTYYSIPVSVKDGCWSYLVIRDAIEKDGTKSFVGAVLTKEENEIDFDTFKPIRTLDKSSLEKSLSIFGQSIEPVKKPVKELKKKYHNNKPTNYKKRKNRFIA